MPERNRWRLILAAVFGVSLLLIPVSGRAATGEETGISAPVPDSLTFMAVGDVYLGSSAEQLGKAKGAGYIFSVVQPLLSRADVLAANHDSPISLKGSVFVQKEWMLHADPIMVRDLVSAGFDYISLANNHAMDYGYVALKETLQVLAANGILCSGAGANLAEARKAAFLTAKGVRFAFLSYSRTYPEEFWATATRPGTAFALESYVKQDVAAAKQAADVVVVSFHWGGERLTDPRGYQISLAKLAIDNGADIILGHHPHILQGIQIYKGKVIAYSLGNFMFGMYSKDVRDSMVLEVAIQDRVIRAVQFHPVFVHNPTIHFRTRPHDPANADRVIRDMQALSARFGTVIENVNGVGVIRLP